MEIEPETGDTQIVSYMARDDAGNIINHQIVEGQVQGGLHAGRGPGVQRAGGVRPESGQLLTGSFMDYAMPRAGLVDGIKLLEHPVPTRLNPLGAKGVGEAGRHRLDAGADERGGRRAAAGGREQFEMPATPARVWQALQAARR